MLASSFSTRFLLRKNRRSRLPAPLGPLFCRPRHGSAAPGPQRQNPGPPRFQLGFCCAKIGAAGRCPHWGQRARSPIFALLKCGPAYSRGVCRGTFLCSTAGPALAPRRLSPFGSISLRETALAGRCPRRGQRARYPIFALLKCGPALAPRRLSPFGSISPPAKPRGRSLPPPGATCSLPHFRSAQMWPRARTPAQPVLFIGQKMRYSVLAGFSSISQCR